MAAPNCQPGYTYFTDSATGPGIDAAWTTQAKVENSSAAYRHDNSSPSGTLDGVLKKTFASDPKSIQAEMKVILNLDTIVSEGFAVSVPVAVAIQADSTDPSALFGLGITVARQGDNIVGQPFIIIKQPDVSDVVIDLPEITIPLSALPLTSEFASGIMRLNMLPDDNVDVLWNGEVVHTTDAAFGLDNLAALLFARYIDEVDDVVDFYGNIKDISYVGPTGYGSNCPAAAPQGDTGSASAPVAAMFPFGI